MCDARESERERDNANSDEINDDNGEYLPKWKLIDDPSFPPTLIISHCTVSLLARKHELNSLTFSRMHYHVILIK